MSGFPGSGVWLKVHIQMRANHWQEMVYNKCISLKVASPVCESPLPPPLTWVVNYTLLADVRSLDFSEDV